MLTEFQDFDEVYEAAVDAIIKLREQCESIKERMDEIIDSCETIEGEL